jgi:hypothetical protein
MRPILGLAFVLAVFAAAPAQATPVGTCRFDPATLTFAGTSVEQARCLLRRVGKFGRLGPALNVLPPALATVVGTAPSLDKARLRAALVARRMDAASLDKPVSRARNGQAGAPLARYFVIHDTSTPWLMNAPFPPDIDSSARINGLRRFLGADAVAHVFVNRAGETAIGHDFSVPFRATKLETKVVGLPAKGLFLHIENVQPRRRDPQGGPKNDALAPVPGFTDLQYDRLALLYAVASFRAGHWLVPAFHAAVDGGLSDAHDDPQNFELAKFDAALAAVLKEVE